MAFARLYQSRLNLGQTLQTLALLLSCAVLCKVGAAAKLAVEGPPGVVVVQAGATATLGCSFPCGTVGVQSTVVEWDMVERGDKILMMDGVPWPMIPRAAWIGDFSTCNASISLSDVRESDSGTYCCSVLLLNMYYEGEAYVTLRVLSPSSVTSKMDSPMASPSASERVGVIAAIMLIVAIAVLLASCVAVKKRRRSRMKRVEGDEEKQTNKRNISIPPSRQNDEGKSFFQKCHQEECWLP
ncbi:uncharacterized protein LOC116938925 isoform X2 [Petromyzon marinus]|uniref:uncharacterized protein LOC116938925 isoform X2 n=1 Tax=Petromyzon marinus TaxID=7757 RepID=UPI0014029B40|nr:V-set and immunoglobulin domain-containing protein 2-like isoform X2 [Petromyzon marinus]